MKYVTQLYLLLAKWVGDGGAVLLAFCLVLLLGGCSSAKVRPDALEYGDGLHDSLAPALTLSATYAAPRANYVVEPGELLGTYDGDTFYITVPECAESLPALCAKLGVRIGGIDTPERKGKCDAESKAATAARAFTDTALRSASTIVLEEVRREKYGRLLAYVVVDGYDLGAELVLRGMARPYDGGPRRGWCE